MSDKTKLRSYGGTLLNLQSGLEFLDKLPPMHGRITTRLDYGDMISITTFHLSPSAPACGAGDGVRFVWCNKTEETGRAQIMAGIEKSW